MKAKLAIVSAVLNRSKHAVGQTIIAALIAVIFVSPIRAQVYTNPVGYVSTTCPANTDTIVGLPLRQTVAAAGNLSANPNTASIPGSAILTLSGSPDFVTNQYASAYYVKFKDTEPTPAAGDGEWFQITANTSNTITVDLNGGSIAGVSGAAVEVLKFWTLNELFPASQCTTSRTTTGNAIVATFDTDEIATQVLIPNLTGVGINLAPTATYYVYNGGWRRFGQPLASDFGTAILWPDSYFIIRNPASVGGSTVYTASGEVEMDALSIPLSTRTAGQQDNFVAIPRGIDITLNQLNLGGTSAFVTTVDTDDIQDQLLVFNNAATGMNKAPSTTYYYYNGAWRKFGQPLTSNFGNDVISTGAGFIIRKAKTAGGATATWNQTASY